MNGYKLNELSADSESVVEAFEIAQTEGRTADIADFLPSIDHPEYIRLLIELIRADMEFSWERGEPRPLEQYRIEFADALRDPGVVRQLAFEDYRLRFQHGEPVGPDQYAETYGFDTRDWPIWSARDGTEGPPERATDRALELHTGCDLEPQYAQDDRRFPEVGTRFGEFELVGVLGEGAFAKVYLARQARLANRFVALKITRNTLEESQRLAQLQHTNIVPVYSIHRDGELYGICMPFLGAATLADLLDGFASQAELPTSGQWFLSTLAARRASTVATHGTIPEAGTLDASSRRSSAPAPLRILAELSFQDAAVWMASRIADGLAHAHERGVIHRDLKPANILLSDDGEPLILDFNLSTASCGTTSGLVGGTLAYMAPEHIEAIQSNGSVDERSDIYSLGVILFELLTGVPPFELRRGSFEQVMRKMLEDRRRAVPSVRGLRKSISPDVESIVSHCLEADPAQRYASVRQVQVDLQRHLDNLPLRYAPNRSLVERGRKWARRHPRVASATSIASLCGLVLLVLLALLGTRSRQLARFRARETFEQFQATATMVRLPLTALDLDAASLKDAVDEGTRLLQQLAAHESNEWLRHSSVRLLDSTRQRQMRGRVAELRYLLAAADLRLAERTGDAGERGRLLADAELSNRLARESYEDVGTPRALLLQEAELAERAGDSERATQLQQRAHAGHPHNVLDRYLLAVEAQLSRDYGDARKRLAELVVQSPQDFSVWYLLGNAYSGLRQFEDAQGCYATCIALRPESYWAYLHRGLTRFQLKRYEEALADFERASSLRPDAPAAAFNRAISLKALGRHEQALEALDAAIKQGATETRIYFVRSRLRKQLGDEEGARRDWEEGLRRVPNDELSWISRGVARAADDPRQALADFRQALALNPRSTVAWQNIAAVLSERLGNTEEAIAAMDSLIALDAGNPTALATRGVLLARLERHDPACSDARAALKLSRDSDTLYRVAGIYSLTSRRTPADAETALQLLAEAAWHDPAFVHRLLKVDPDLKPLSSREKFRQLEERLAGVDQLRRGKRNSPLSDDQAEQ